MMKKLFPLLLVLTLCVVAGCSKDSEDENIVKGNEVISVVDNQSGIMQYDDSNNRWFISFHVQGSIDSVIRYYPIQLKQEFKKREKHVVFSGTIYSLTFSINQTGGMEAYLIELISIKETN